MAKILLVDDSSFQRKTVGKMLTSMGHEVIGAENGQTGLDVAESDRPDLIVTDLHMPVMDGIAYLRGLRSLKLSIPVIVASADIQDSSREECLRLGAVAFLNKPVDGAAMEEAIATSLSDPKREESRC